MCGAYSVEHPDISLHEQRLAPLAPNKDWSGPAGLRSEPDSTPPAAICFPAPSCLLLLAAAHFLRPASLPSGMPYRDGSDCRRPHMSCSSLGVCATRSVFHVVQHWRRKEESRGNAVGSAHEGAKSRSSRSARHPPPCPVRVGILYWPRCSACSAATKCCRLNYRT